METYLHRLPGHCWFYKFSFTSILRKGRLLIICYLVCLPCLVFTQKNINDSLRKIVNNARNDTAQANALLELARDFVNNGDNDTGIAYANRALALSTQLKYQKGAAYSYKWLGLASGSKGNYFEALDNSNKSLTIFETIGDKEGILNLLNNLGAFYFDNGEDSKASEYHLKVLDLAEKAGNKKRIENSLGNLGILYARNPATIKKALEYDLRAYKVALSINNKDDLGLLTANLGEVYTTIGNFDSAYYFLQQSIGYIEYSPLSFYSYSTLGKLYIETKNYDSAIVWYMKAFGTSFQGNSRAQMATANNGIANAYFLKHNLKQAITYYGRALNNLKTIDAIAESKETYKGLAATYHEMGDFNNAYKYEALLNTRYTLEYENKLKFNTAALEYTMELQKQSGQIAELRKANELQVLLLEKEKFAKNASATAFAVLLIFAFILLRNIRHRKKLNQLLYKQKEEIELQKVSVENALTELKSTQSQLIQSEKMASLGELTAGIAHEIQNPLNFVNNFSEVTSELVEEMKMELENGNNKEVLAIASDLQSNLLKILHHGKRADGIVRGMLQHSRSSTGQKEPTDINPLLDEFLRLTYHGIKAKDRSFNPTLKTNFDKQVGKLYVIPQDFGRAILNVITNALYAVNERYKQNSHGYEPTVTVTSKKENQRVYISVQDNGNGIAAKVLDKIFQPFFTTKPAGEGTGLGLSLSYDIIKMHGGDISVTTKVGEGTVFTIQLPVA